MVFTDVLGATCRGCDLLGELAENMNADIDRESTDNKQDEIREMQTGDEPHQSSKTSLRRSLSLVLLSELATPVKTRDSEISDNKVAHYAADVAQHMSPVTRISSKEHCISSQQRHSLNDSSDDFSVTEIPPLSHRLQMNHLHSDSAMPDLASHGGVAIDELPLSGSSTESSDALQKDHSKQSSQRIVNSDSAVLPGRRQLPSRRRRALNLRAAGVLSDDDVFLDSTKLRAAETTEHRVCSSDPIETENVSDDNNGSGGTDTDVFHLKGVDIKQKENISDTDIVKKFQSMLHIGNECENLDPVSANKSCLPEEYPVTATSNEFVDTDHIVTTSALTSSFDTVIQESSSTNSGQLMWSPRHCGNFCIETSIINIPSMNFSDSDENALQDHELSPGDINDTVSNKTRTSCSSDGITHSDEVSSNCDAFGMSDLLFDDPVSPEEKLMLPLNVPEDHCSISATDNGDSHCNQCDYSVIIID